MAERIIALRWNRGFGAVASDASGLVKAWPGRRDTDKA
jgi:hypothetical protein